MASVDVASVLVDAQDPDLRELLSQVLREALAIDVLSCDLHEAIQHVTTAKPTLVILDMPVPWTGQMESLALPSWTESAEGNVTVIALTGLQSERDKALQLGCAAYLDKPFELDDLLSMVAHHLPHRLAG